MDKRLFKRMCRGLGLPVVDWREVGAARWRDDPAAVTGRARGFRRRRRRPAPHGQAVGPRVVGRHDPRPRPRRAARGAGPGVPLRHPRPRRDATSPGARDLEVAILGNDALELYGPGEIVSGHEFYDYAAKYTPGLSETSTAAEVSPAQKALILKLARDTLPGDRLRGLRPRRLPGRRRADRRLRDQHDPGLHPDQPLPDDAVRPGGYAFADVCERVVELARERAAARDHRPPHRSGPAAMSLRPPTRRQTPLGPGRRTPRVRRASSARLTPIRAGAALVMLASLRRALRRVVVERLRLRARPAHVGPRLDGPRGGRGRHRRRPRPEPVPHLDRSARDASWRRLPTVARARIGVEFPDTLAVTLDERTPILIWKVGDLQFLVDADGKLFAELPDVPSAATAGLPVVDDGRAASAGLIAGSTLDPVDLDAATRLASLVPADVGSSATGLSIVLTDENGFLVRSDPRGWTAVFGIYTPTIRTPGPHPGQVRLLRSLLAGREDTVERVILASGTRGPTSQADPVADPDAQAHRKPTPKPTPSRPPAHGDGAVGQPVAVGAG